MLSSSSNTINLDDIDIAAHIRPMHSRQAVCVVTMQLLGTVGKCKLTLSRDPQIH